MFDSPTWKTSLPITDHLSATEGHSPALRQPRRPKAAGHRPTSDPGRVMSSQTARWTGGRRLAEAPWYVGVFTDLTEHFFAFWAALRLLLSARSSMRRLLLSIFLIRRLLLLLSAAAPFIHDVTGNDDGMNIKLFTRLQTLCRRFKARCPWSPPPGPSQTTSVDS